MAYNLKSKFILIIVLIVALLALAALVEYLLIKRGDNNSDDDNPPPEIISLAHETDQFSFDLAKKLSNEKDKNIFASPLSISMSLSLLANGAESETQAQIIKGLGFQNTDINKINLFNQNLISNLKSDKNKKLSLANATFADKDFEMLDSFKKNAKDSYSVDAQNLDFTSAASADKINAWAKDKTEDKIKKIIDADTLKDLRLLIANAVYFKADWQEKFDKNSTKEEEFTTPSGKKQVPLMRNTLTVKYLKENDFQMAILPYKDKNIEFIVFLPKEGQELKTFINNLTQENFDKYLTSAKEQEIDLKLPRLELEYEKNFNEILKKLGMTDMFNAKKANFKQLSEKEDLMVDYVKHQSFVKIDEEGTEAAAVTSIGMKTTAIPTKPEEMFINRPYFFVIREKSQKVNLFMGAISEP